ncbi:hypothetical protein C7E18_00890, partial [Stenotrophomonas maltophilia]
MRQWWLPLVRADGRPHPCPAGCRDELLGINGCFAHLAQTLDLARRRGARLVTLV